MSTETPRELSDEPEDIEIFIEELCGRFLLLGESVEEAIQKVEEAIARIEKNI